MIWPSFVLSRSSGFLPNHIVYICQSKSCQCCRSVSSEFSWKNVKRSRMSFIMISKDLLRFVTWLTATTTLFTILKGTDPWASKAYVRLCVFCDLAPVGAPHTGPNQWRRSINLQAVWTFPWIGTKFSKSSTPFRLNCYFPCTFLLRFESDWWWCWFPKSCQHFTEKYFLTCIWNNSSACNCCNEILSQEFLKL